MENLFVFVDCNRNFALMFEWRLWIRCWGRCVAPRREGATATQPVVMSHSTQGWSHGPRDRQRSGRLDRLLLVPNLCRRQKARYRWRNENDCHNKYQVVDLGQNWSLLTLARFFIIVLLATFTVRPSTSSKLELWHAPWNKNYHLQKQAFMSGFLGVIFFSS